MQKRLLIVSGLFLLTACSEQTPEQVQFQQQKELMAMQMAHEVTLAKINAGQNVHYEVSQSNIESVSGNSESMSYTGSGDADSSSDGGDLLLAGATGMVAGYALGELLDSGYRTGTDASGRVHYYDGSGKEISKSDYERHRAKHPVKSKARDLTVEGRDKAGKLSAKAKEGVAKAKPKAIEAAKKTKQKAKSFKKKVSKYKPSKRRK